MSGYELSRKWFDFCFDHPEKIKPNHSALYFFAIEHCNRLGWKEKFGFPTEMAKDAIGIKNYRTYINTLNDLVDMGFIKMIERSKNQYSANIIALVNYTKATTKALDKASIKHSQKQSKSNYKSIDSIYKQGTKNKEQYNFDIFWNDYHIITKLNKTDKEPTITYWKKLILKDKQNAIDNIQDYYNSVNDKKYLKKARTYLKDKSFNDEFTKVKTGKKLYEQLEERMKNE